jgi:high-affinity nickel-transport protein
MLALGLRHGIDPDHIAVIDSFTLKFHQEKLPNAKWVGTIFAFGHGIVVTIVSVLIAYLGNSLILNVWLSAFLEWIPTLLLYLIVIINLKNLFSNSDVKIIGWRNRLIPNKYVKGNLYHVFLTGVIFALVFDTITQAAAWSYAASHENEFTHSLFMGVFFSFGMIAVDTIDGHILHQLLKNTESKKNKNNYRKCLSWFIIIMSLFMAVYKSLIFFNQSWILSDNSSLIIGSFFLIFIVFIYVITMFRQIRKKHKN